MYLQIRNKLFLFKCKFKVKMLKNLCQLWSILEGIINNEQITINNQPQNLQCFEVYLCFVWNFKFLNDKLSISQIIDKDEQSPSLSIRYDYVRLYLIAFDLSLNLEQYYCFHVLGIWIWILKNEVFCSFQNENKKILINIAGNYKTRKFLNQYRKT